MKKYLFIAAALVIESTLLRGQDEKKTPVTLSGYAEVYYSRDFRNPASNTRPAFVYSHNRANEVSVNLAYLKADYRNEHVRASLALATGSYMNANYAAEPGVLKNIYEAYAGVKISKKHNLWLDAGVFPSHLGFESAIGKDNWTLTRSLFADNSPYFEAGAKVSYTSQDNKWLLSGLILNGWQRIQRVDGNSTPAFGHQLTFRPTENLVINSASFIGNDKPDSLRQMRYFHNFYAIYQLSPRWGITAGFDVGAEQKHKGSAQKNMWLTPVLVARCTFSDRFSISGRGEYYRDPGGVIVTAPGGFETWGFSLNTDWSIRSNVMWRAEVRNLNARRAIFADGSHQSHTSSWVATSALAISF